MHFFKNNNNVWIPEFPGRFCQVSPALAESLSWRARRTSHSKTSCSAGRLTIWWRRPVCFWLRAGGRTWWSPRRSWPPASSCASYLQVGTGSSAVSKPETSRCGFCREGEKASSEVHVMKYEAQCERGRAVNFPQTFQIKDEEVL